MELSGREAVQRGQFEWFQYVYVMQCNGLYKIGFAKSPSARVRTLQIGSPHPVRLVHILRTSSYKMIEHQLHGLFKKKCVRGEWFRLDQSDLRYIQNLDAHGFWPGHDQYQGRPEPDLNTHWRIRAEWREVVGVGYASESYGIW